MPPEFEDDELEGLSAEELAAIGDDDDEDAILKAIAGDGADGEEGDDDDQDGANHDASDDGAEADDPRAGADEGTANADGAQSATAVAQAGADGADGADDPATPPSPHQSEFQPKFSAAVPENLDAKLADVEARAADLLSKLKEGDIDLPDFIAQNQAINDERMQLRLVQEQARWAEQQNETTRAQRWQWEQERFFGQEKAGIYKDPIVLAALSASVQQLAGDAANSNRAPAWFLEEADRQVRERMNIGAPRQEKPGKPNRQPDLSATPKTLANLPAAEIPDTGADEFAYLEKLLDKDPMAYEAALRKLTPEQEARYLGVA